MFGRRSVFDSWSRGLICCEEIEKLAKGSLGPGSKSERRFDACQQGMNIQSFAETQTKNEQINFLGLI